ncbi:MAG: shikimate kinase [Caldilineaceae bacterium]|nr:shikimate kinase [Caldilineaceae bacterium]
MLVVFIYGPAASGKHTVGSLVADQLDIPLFHNHLTVDLVGTLFDFGTEPFRRLRANIWRASFRECAKADRSFVFAFHPEATVESDEIGDLIRIVEEAGGSLFFVELLCARSAVLARLANESRRRFGKLTDPALYATIEAAGGFEFHGLPEPDLQIDTEIANPEDAAAAIVAAVKTAGPTILA